jgi:Mce-associated membrane protein
LILPLTIAKPMRAVGGFFALALDTMVQMFKPPLAHRWRGDSEHRPIQPRALRQLTGLRSGRTVNTNFGDEVGDKANECSDTAVGQRGSGIRLALVLGLVMVLALAGLVSWLGHRAYESHQAQEQRRLFLQVGRQGALNLTTISYTETQADVQRILDSATGSFYDDFQKRSPAFIEIVKQAQSKSEGTVTEAGLESEGGDQGQVLVAVTVKTSTAGTAEPQPRAWRMRIGVQKVGDGAKVSNVEFVS